MFTHILAHTEFSSVSHSQLYLRSCRVKTCNRFGYKAKKSFKNMIVKNPPGWVAVVPYTTVGERNWALIKCTRKSKKKLDCKLRCVIEKLISEKTYMRCAQHIFISKILKSAYKKRESLVLNKTIKEHWIEFLIEPLNRRDRGCAYKLHKYKVHADQIIVQIGYNKYFKWENVKNSGDEIM